MGLDIAGVERSAHVSAEAVWEDPSQKLPQSPAFYSPDFLYGLRDILEGRTPIDRQNPVITLPSSDPVKSGKKYSVYIVDEAGQIQAHRLVDNPDAVVRENMDRNGEEFLGYEDPFITRIQDSTGNVEETQFRIYRIKGVGDYALVGNDEVNFPVHRQRPSSIRHGLEREYLKSHFDLHVSKDAPPVDFSRAAQLAAWKSVRGVGNRRLKEIPAKITPVVTSPFLAQWIGAQSVFVKDEGKQYQGSFKVRGAFYYMDYMRRWGGIDPSITPIVAASHGNHAQGVIRGANLLGYHSTFLVLPNDPQTQRRKIKACLDAGANVLLAGHGFPEALGIAQEMSQKGILQTIDKLNTQQADSIMRIQYNPAEWSEIELALDRALKSGDAILLMQNSTQDLILPKPMLVPTYDDPRTSMGQGTDAMELVAQEPSLIEGGFVYAAPFGGGGKLAGDGTYLKDINPNVRLVGVNVEKAPVLRRSLENGFLDIWPEEFEMAEDNNLADGTAVPNPGKFTFEQIQKLGAEAGIVTNDEVAEALVLMDSQAWYQANGVAQRRRIEGAPASVVAAMINGAMGNLQNERVVMSVSGENIDEATIKRVYDLKGWIVNDLPFYKAITKLRSRIRSQHDKTDVEKDFKIAQLNELLKSKTARNKLRAVLMADGSDSSLRLVPVLNEIANFWQPAFTELKNVLVYRNEDPYFAANRTKIYSDKRVLARVMPLIFALYAREIEVQQVLDKLVFWHKVFTKYDARDRAAVVTAASRSPLALQVVSTAAKFTSVSVALPVVAENPLAVDKTISALPYVEPVDLLVSDDSASKPILPADSVLDALSFNRAGSSPWTLLGGSLLSASFMPATGLLASLPALASN